MADTLRIRPGWSPLLVLYVVNAALLLVHEIDSAFWHEWEMFGIPGGIQLFVLLDFLFALMGLTGLVWTAQGRNAGRVASLILACAGITACILHGSFLLTGHPSFRLPASLLVLGSVFVVSMALGTVAIRELRGRSFVNH